MLIIGAKGFAKEVLEVFHRLNQLDYLTFYDDVNMDIPDKLYGQFPVLKSINEAEDYFKKIDNRFTIGIGNPVLRKRLCDKFIGLGGVFTSTVSEKATIGYYDNNIEIGCNILAGSYISNSISIGRGCIIYYNSVITHDCEIGDFVEISPNVTLLGRCKIGSYTQIGANVTVLPDIKVGENVIIAAGAVITKNVPSNCMIAGIPAIIKKELTPLSF